VLDQSNWYGVIGFQERGDFAEMRRRLLSNDVSLGRASR
jgi:hypothetical protein